MTGEGGQISTRTDKRKSSCVLKESVPLGDAEKKNKKTMVLVKKKRKMVRKKERSKKE